MISKKTMVLGASTNPSRYSFMATHRLKENKHQVIPVGIKKGSIAELPIINGKPLYQDIDTLTLYIGEARQKEYYDYILELNPKRVIFNPGTYNLELMDLLRKNSIEVVEACTLVMLSVGNY